MTTTKKTKKGKKKKKNNKKYQKGYRFERRVWKFLEKQGYHCKRSYGSKGPVDLYAMKLKKIKTYIGDIKNGAIDGFTTASEIMLMQCKNLKIGYSPLSEEETEGLVKIAKITGGIPYHVYNDLKHKIVFKEIYF